MTTAVLGAGGVGGLVAALLARAGDTVILVVGEAAAPVLAARGLQVDSARFGRFAVGVRVVTRLDEAVDACLVTVKNTQLEQAVERVPPASVAHGGLVVPFLNGVDHLDRLRARYGEDAVVAAAIRVETATVGRGEIEHTSPFAAVELAGEDDPRVHRLAVRLAAAGLDVRERGDAAAVLWEKLAFLAPLALLTTHEGAAAGEVRIRRRDDLWAVVGEVAAVAGTAGVVIDAAAIMERLDSVPATMQSSMQRDAAAGRPTELDAIGGAVVRRAQAAGVPVPRTAWLVEELRARG